MKIAVDTNVLRAEAAVRDDAEQTDAATRAWMGRAENGRDCRPVPPVRGLFGSCAAFIVFAHPT